MKVSVLGSVAAFTICMTLVRQDSCFIRIPIHSKQERFDDVFRVINDVHVLELFS